jgi:hypothetical protein
MSNKFVPLFIFPQIDTKNMFSASNNNPLPDGSYPLYTPSSATNLMIGKRTFDNGEFTYNCGYVNYNGDLNDGRAKTKNDYNYYYCYDLTKLCFFLAQSIVQQCGFTDPNSVIISYDNGNNVFILSVEDTLLSIDIVVNKAFIDKFPFAHTKIQEDLYILVFENKIPNIINNVQYDTLTAYIPYEFLPFDSVILTTNMSAIRQIPIYSKVGTTSEIDSQPIIQSFDRISTSLNFYDYYVVNYDYLTNYISFNSDTQDGDLTFSLYLYNSKTNNKIYCSIDDNSLLNFNFIIGTF